MPSTIVVGGGIVGSSVAYHLARDGVDTLLIDRMDAGRATDAAAGVVSPATSSQNASDTWFEFAAEAFAFADALDRDLRADGDEDTGYDRRGLLAVAFDDDELEEFEDAKRRTFDRRSPGGYLDPDTVYELSGDEAVERFPPLAAPRRALYFEDAVRIDGRTFADALRRAGVRHGLRVQDANVEALRIADGAVTGVEATDGTVYEATDVVIAGGAWSSAFADQLGVDVPVEPVRGQVVHLDPVDADTSAWPIVVSFRDKVLAPWSDGRVAIGATRESGVGFERRTTAAGVKHVLDELVRIAPGLGEAVLDDVRIGFRPVSVDGLPVLGEVPTVDGAYLATGHGATGITHGPYSGALVADAVQGRTPRYDLSDFDVARFD